MAMMTPAVILKNRRRRLPRLQGRGTRPGPSAFTHPGPPPAVHCPLDVVGLRQGAALEFLIDARDQSTQVLFGSGRKVQHRPLQIVTSVFHLYPRRADLGGVQVAARLLEGPLEPRERIRDRVGPHLLVFDPADRCTSPRGDTADPQDRILPSWPPPLCADGLGTPTRHRPFGSTSGHPATAGHLDGPRFTHPRQMFLLLGSVQVLGASRSVTGAGSSCGAVRIRLGRRAAA